ncbi:MAG: site-specific integrase [Bacteroidales bacterium]|nr:site-specific integrase [Bacteroidales bacterium]MCF8405243.1 site-specific integrase [Bacteroidales bacterium]
MANLRIKLNLDKIDQEKPNKEVYIFYSVFYNGKRFRIYSGFNVKVNNWNKKKQEYRTNEPDYENKNSLLSKGKNEIETAINKARLGDIEITKQLVISKLSFSKHYEGDKSFTDYFEEFIRVRSNSKAKSTVVVSKTTLKHLKSFSREYNYQLSFENMNLGFYEKFEKYIFKDLKLLNNSFGKYIKTLKTFLYWATEKGYNSFSDYKKFKTINEPTEPIPLTLSELKLIENESLNESLTKVRDIFLIECYSGLRFSDIQQLTPENIKGDYIHLKTQKTDQTLKLPISKRLNIILEKYQKNFEKDGSFIPKISNQKMNEYLKEICKKAQINDNIVIYKNRGGERIKEIKPKNELITTHTGRDTFITNSLLLEIPDMIVMEIVGHKKYETFKRYIKFKDEHLKEKISVWDNI